MQQPNNKESNKPWYKKLWIMIPLGIFVAPVIIITVIATIYGAIVGVQQSAKNDQDKPQQTQAQESQRPKDPDMLNVSASHNAEAIEFINNESKDFSSCTFTLNQDYSYNSGKAYMVTSGQHAALYFANFTKDDGTRFNIYQTKPKYLSAWCHRKDGDSGKADIFWD